MRPLADWPLADRRNIIGIFTDIDDTLTTDGAITRDALQALAKLQAVGLHVIPITGRPIGWSELFARGDAARGVAPWPVDAIVAENGAVAFACKNLLTTKIYQQNATTRATNCARMQDVIEQVLREVPSARLSQDSAGRETDIAIDHSEFTHLCTEDIARVTALMQDAGMTATVSSIHINGWFGEHNKLEGARWIVRELFDRDLDAELSQWAYVGDSTNDQLMFEHFPHSVGVANIRRFVNQLLHLPRYITRSERGAGFAEVAHYILEARCR
ncbi:MAG: HAD-IIB family hydrolase [Comamonadaceae bacterium]